MKKMLEEFKAFIIKGDVVIIAVGLVMALYFKHRRPDHRRRDHPDHRRDLRRAQPRRASGSTSATPASASAS